MDTLPLSDTIVTVADWMKANSIGVPADLAANIEAVKTQAYYQRALWDWTQRFYNNKVDVSAFLDKFIGLVEDQLRRAWNEGMRNVGLDPARDMLPLYQAHLQKIIDAEFNQVLDFAGAIEKARQEGKPVEPLRARVQLWSNRYQNVVNEAMAVCKPGERYEWVYGDTKKHCSSCARLAGTVATGDMWRMSGVMPQNPPNAKLECGGWRCRCRLVRTDRPLSEMGIPQV